MSRQKFAICVVIGCVALVSSAISAQEPGDAAKLYNDGVQAYFRGCSAEAESLFSTLMSVDPDDPRAFYFRALILCQQGREEEARTDMQVGAQLEARFPHRFDIGKTLERVQGSTRLMLERYRSSAHQMAAVNPPRGALRSSDAAVLREQRYVPLDEFARAGVPQSIASPVPVQEIAKPTAATVTPPQNLTPAPAGLSDPFQEDATESPAPKPHSKMQPAKPQQLPAKTLLPPAPKPEAPKAKAEDTKPSDENPF